MSDDWTLPQATELVLEQLLTALEGADDDDTVRPALALKAIREAWAPEDAPDDSWIEGLSVGEVRARIATARGSLG